MKITVALYEQMAYEKGHSTDYIADLFRFSEERGTALEYLQYANELNLD
tara:strand:- start:21550 stop:21696 length:147 start_codon:yes stop_codon:yes gene_type:complete